MRIQLDRDILRAALKSAGKNDIRYYLNGVKIEMFANVAYVVAADGHRMAVARVPRVDGDIWEGSGAVIVPRELIEGIKGKSRSIVACILTVADGEPGEREITLQDFSSGSKSCAKEIDGQFPDWRRVVPAKVSGETAQFNADYLADIKKTAEILGLKSAAIAHNGNSAGLAVLRDDFMIVLMPMREDPAKESPEWTREDAETFGRMDVETAWADAYPPTDLEAVAEAA